MLLYVLGGGLSEAVASVGAGALGPTVSFYADTTESERFKAAVEQWREGRPTEARRRLRSLWTANRSLYVPEVGSVAYWYGRVLKEAEGPTEALKVWQVGLSVLGMKEAFDPRLNDAYVNTVFRRELTSRYEQATGAYLDLFEHYGALSEADARARKVVHRHAAQMAFLLPDDRREKFLRRVDQEGAVGKTYDLRSGQGPALAAWWRGQDPVPRTGRNERVEEHLQRVAVAQETYAYERGRRGFDARGEVYVRLGPPGQTREVSLAGLQRYEFPGAPIKANETDLPKHEIWYYPKYGKEAVYIFVWRQGRHQLSGPQALLPQSVRGPYDSKGQLAERGEAKLAVLAMERILSELRMNTDYNRLYSEVSDYMNQVGIPGSGVSGGGGGRDVDRSKSDGNIRAAQRQLPATFAKKTQSSGEATRRQVAHVRRQVVPQQETGVNEDLSEVPVFLRRARFLDADGSTRTLLYWAHPNQALTGSDYLFFATAVQRGREYTRTRQQSRRYVRRVDEEGLQAWALPVEGASGTYHLHLQLDQYEVEDASQGSEVRRGELVGRSTARLDSIEALEAEENGLLMSDLLPGLVPQQGNQGEEAAAGMALSPYPFPSLDPSMDPVLYFEVYGLAYGADERTRMRVSYEVERRTEGGAFRLFRDQRERTRTETTREGRSRKMVEYIELDLGDLEGADQVRITVQVTDLVTDQSVERTLTLGVSK